jgi:NAD(P)-dependent dehydrogenase (short-subunit alcohol dehydrogenase family)
MDVNANGVLFTAQAAGRQMVRFGTPGSIILVASMNGSITNKASVSLALKKSCAECVVVVVVRTGTRMGGV